MKNLLPFLCVFESLVVPEVTTSSGPSTPPPTGLYFELNDVMYYDGDTILISDIGHQPPDDRSDPGSTLVCVTTNVNTACCRKSDNNGLNNATAGAVGEWRYPNHTLVPRRSGNVDFVRIAYSHHVRLAREVSTSIPPLGVYSCEVPDLSGVILTATITLIEQVAAPSAVEVSSSRNGGSMDLTCSITLSSSLPGGATLQVIWTGPSGTLNGTTPIDSGSSYTSVLSVSSLSASDAGTYSCSASIQSSRPHLLSSTSLSGSTVIDIQIGAPSVTVSTPASLFSVGDSTSLTCTIMLETDLISGTSLEVSLTLPDNSVRMAGGSSDATLTGSGTFYESVLTIPTLSLSLAGSYICSAIVTSTLPLTTNSETVMDSSVVEVQAEAPSPVAIVTPSQSFMTGNSISLQCNVMLMSGLATGTSLEVTWSLPNSSSMIAGSTGDVTLVGGGTAYTSNLTIPSLAASHAGVFNCSARITSTLSYITNSGIVVGSTVVALQSRPPSSVIVSSSPSVIYEGTTFTLTCSIYLFEEMNNLMTLNVTWTVPAGATLTGTLSGSGTSYTSTSMAVIVGSYTCSARLVSHREHLTSSTNTMSTITVMTVPAPSAPTMISATPQTTTISLTWTQPPGDVVDSYTISYTSVIEECIGTSDFSTFGSISGNDSSMRSYTLINLEENSVYAITVEAVNGAGGTSSSILTTWTSGAAPSVPPVLRVTSATPTTISIAWDEIPCLMRNGRIFRYIVSLCHVSVANCLSFTIVNDVSNRVLTFNNLIPRYSYNSAIRADSQNPRFIITYIGFFSSPIIVDTAAPQGLGFFLDGGIYPPNVALDLTDIGVDGDSLRCLTPLISCCRGSDNPNGGALGNWRFPNRSIVYSRNSGNDISRTRGASSILLHRIYNVLLPTGVYTCEIPHNYTTTRELNVYLYAGRHTDLTTALEYVRNTSQLICTVRGGLVNSYTWTRYSVLISDSDPLFTQTLTIADRSSVTSELILSSANNSSLVGTYQCIVTDGNGRMAKASLQMNGVATRSFPFAPAVVGEATNLTCTNKVGQASIMEWQSEDGTVLASATLSNILDLMFAPVNDSLTIHGRQFICQVTRNGTIFNQSFGVPVSVPVSSVALSLSTQGSLLAGSELNVKCAIAGQTSGLTGSYMTSISAVSIPGSITTTSQEDGGVSVLNIYPLRTSYPTMYTCHGSYFSPAGNRTLDYKDSLIIKVQVSTPDVSLVVSSDSLLIAGGVDGVTLICSASVDRGVVDFGDLVYSFTWYNSEGEVIMSSNRTIISSNNNMSTLTLSPLSVDDSNITCSVLVADWLGLLNSSAAGYRYIKVNVQRPDPPVIQISHMASSTAGEVYSLTCDVSLSQNLRQSPVIEWVGPDGNVIDNTTLRDVSLTSSSPSTTMTLLFNPLRTSHRGVYWCRSTLTDSAANIRFMNISSLPLIVQVPSPPVIIKESPIDKGFHIGLILTFSATITLNSAVDSPGDIQVASSWTSPRTASSTGTVNSSSSPISYYNNLTINLQDTEMDSGVYTVTFSIISFSSYLIGDILNGSRHISVEAFPPQRVTVLEEIRVTAGGEASLLCNAVRQDTLSSSTLLEIFWLHERIEVIKSTSGHISGPTSSIATNITSRLTVSNIRTSQAGVYSCVVNMTIPGVVEDHQVIESSDISVYIPPATSITLSGSRPGPLYWGTSLTLTCIVNYDTPLVDTPVSFCINITGPQTNSVTTNTTANVSIATFNPLLPVHDGSYVCSFSISPSSESLFVLPSMSASSSLLDLVLTELPVPVVSVSSATVTEAGQFLSLTCRVDVVEYLTVNPQLEWRQLDGYIVNNTGNPSIRDSVEVMGRVSTFNVSFSPLLTSHAGEYQCRASISIPNVSPKLKSYNITSVFVQIPPPVVVVSVTSESLVAGGVEDVNITCTATVNYSVVDSADLVYSYTWRNSLGQLITKTKIKSVGNVSTLTLSPLSSLDTNLSCRVIVSERLGRLHTSHGGDDLAPLRIIVPDAPVIDIRLSGSSTAGKVYSLICDVSLSQNLRQTPVIEWVGPDGNVIDNTTLRDVSLTSFSPSTTMTLLYNPLRTSHRGTYWCRATLTDTAANIRLMNNSSVEILVQGIPPSTLLLIKGFPVDYYFFKGLQLNLTCFYSLTFSPFDENYIVSVDIEWRKSESSIIQDNRLSVSNVVETRPLHYQCSLLFASLDKNRDEDNYTCFIRTTVQRLYNNTISLISITHTLDIPTLYFQVHFGSILNCDSWKSTEARLKNEDVLRDIVQVVSSSCGCDFTSDCLTDSVFLCSSSSPNSVTYQAQLHGTLQANVYQLADIILEEFYTKKKSVRIQFSLLPVIEFCIVPANSNSPCRRLSATSTEQVIEEASSQEEKPTSAKLSPTVQTSSSSIGLVAGVAVAIFIIIVLLVIFLSFCLYIRKRKYVLTTQQNTLNKVNTASLHMTNLAEDSLHYEDIEKYQCSDYEMVEVKDIGTTVCPAYESSSVIQEAIANKK